MAIEHKSVSVYDNLEDGEEKPAVGEGLNKPTTVTLYDVFPRGDDPSSEQKRRYEERVAKNTRKIGQLNEESVCYVIIFDHYSQRVAFMRGLSRSI